MQDDPNLIVGLDKPDDAGVYRITDELALVQTVDYITPVVDDPYTFGMVATANSLSDIWAMGAKPLTAMNIVCFPEKKAEISILAEILKGSLDKLNEVGVILVGGHTVRNEDLKFGLSVTGLVHPKKVITKGGGKVGDKLVLTKPVGMGLITTAYKLGLVTIKSLDKIAEVMIKLNDKASEIAVRVGVNAMTDVTGFAMIGHSSEMAEQGDVSIELYSENIPFITCDDGKLAKGLKALANELRNEAMLPQGLYDNEEYRSHMVDRGQIDDDLMTILYDPQTSGGLLIAVSPEKADDLLEQIRQAGDEQAAVVGQIIEGIEAKVVVR